VCSSHQYVIQGVALVKAVTKFLAQQAIWVGLSCSKVQMRINKVTRGPNH